MRFSPARIWLTPSIHCMTYGKCTLLILGLASVSVAGQCCFEGPARVEAVAIGNLISWKAVSEVASIRYLIQVSVDGRQFRTLGAEKGRGAGDYRFLDLAPLGEGTVYRIMAVAPDGRTGYCLADEWGYRKALRRRDPALPGLEGINGKNRRRKNVTP